MYGDIEKVYLLYYHDLYRFIAKGCSNTEIVDDIIQNTFLEALKSIENYKGDSSLKTWLFGIAKHQLYQYFRKNKLHVDIDDLAEIELTSESDFSDKLLAEKIMETINELAPPLNEIMRLRLIYGLSFKEIGVRIDRTENFCRVNFFRIKEKLRKEYNYE